MTSGLEAIRNRILEKARQEAVAMIRKAIDEKNQVLSSAKQEAERIASQILEEAKARAQAKYEERLGVIRTDLRKQLLLTREELIEQAWSRALGRLKIYVQSEGYLKNLKDLVLGTAELVEDHEFVVDANSRDLARIREWKDEIQRALSDRGNAKRIIIGQEIDCIGGIQVSDVHRRFILDRTYDAKIRRLKPAMRSKLAEILTGGME